MDQDLKNLLAEKSTPAESKPTVFDLSQKTDQEKVKALLIDHKIQIVVDDFREQHQELFAINNPTKVYTPNFKQEFEDYFKALGQVKSLEEYGKWVYYPWLGTLVHLLDDTEFQRVRTARNRNLISEEEQSKFYNATVGLGGLSVGNSVALAIVLQGGAKRFRLADFDRLALTNLNRIRGGVESLGLKKVEMTARQIYTLNPYAQIELFDEGLNPENIDKFFDGLDLVIDELDNIAVKYLIREYAKKYKLPVVMGADNGDNAVVDVERYDLDPNIPFFHGRIGEVSFEQLSNLDKFAIGKTITKHIGPENVTEKMQNSLLEMGKTIVSWPQLGGAALLNGSAVAYCVRRILNGQEVESNRAIISLDEKLDSEYNTEASQNQRLQVTERFKKIMGL